MQPRQRAGGRQHHAHGVPRVRAPRGRRRGRAPAVGGVGRQRGEDDAGGAEHDRERPGAVDADAERAGGLVARAGDLGRLVRRGEPRARQLQRVEHLLAPAAVRDVEEQRARCVGGVDRVLAGQSQPHVVLRQQHVADPRVDVGLVAPQPEQLRRRESGQRAIAGQLDQPVEPDALLDLGALRRRALVVPEDRRPQHALRLVEARRARASAREADRPTRRRQLRERRLRGAPPVLRILLGPARPRRRERIPCSARASTSPSRRDRDPLDAGRADVEPDEAAPTLAMPRAPHRRARTPAPRPCAPVPRAAPARRSSGDAVDEPPVQHRALDRRDLVLRIRVEVEAEPLAVRAVAGAPQLERQLQRLHERGRADHVVVVEGAPAGVRVLVAEQPLRREQRRVLRQVLAVHDQVLPVHVHLDVRDPALAQLVDHEQGHADVPHVDLHRGLGVLVLEEEQPAVRRESLRRLRDPVEQARPDLGVGHLERIVVALAAGPDDHVRADLAGEIGGLQFRPQRLGAHRVVERGQAAPAEAWVDVQAATRRVDPVPVERRAHVVEVVVRQLAG